MKNKKVWRMIKKILRTICIWGIIAVMTIPALAVDNIETVPLHKYITLRWFDERWESAQVRASDTENFEIAGAGTGTYYRAILAYQSALDKNTFYHMRLKMESTNSTSQNWINNLNTGVITNQGGEIVTLLMPATTLSPYANTINQAINTNKEIQYSYTSAMSQSMTSYVGAKAYYYFTKNSNTEVTIDAIFYFNDEFFNYGWSYDASATRYMQCYLGIMVPMAGGLRLEGMEVYPVGGSDYNGKLDQIIALLQAQGGGLSEEDIKHATVEALRQHEQEEQLQAQQGTQDAQQQAEQALTEYTATIEDVMDALDNLNTMFAYEGTDCVITVPGVDNPITGGHFEGASVDLATYYNKIPLAMRSMVRIVFTFAVYSAIIRELYNTIRKMTEVTE